MTEVEKELVEASGFKPKKQYKERQDYLTALARAVDVLDDDAIDGLSNEAQAWYGNACDAVNEEAEIPDFDEEEVAEDDSEAEEASDDTSEDDDAAEESEEDDELDPTDENDTDDSDNAEDEPEEKPKAKVKAKAKEKAPKEKPAKKAVEKEKPKAKEKEKAKEGPRRKVPPVDPDKFDIDEFEVVVGSKNHEAVKMLQKGCRMSDITKEIGGTYYNLLKRLVKDGHTLEKEGNGVLRLIHKDGKKAKGKK